MTYALRLLAASLLLLLLIAAACRHQAAAELVRPAASNLFEPMKKASS